MCGIVGEIGLAGRAINRRALTAANAALAHRGPDGEGLYVGDGIGLGHRRLSIIDLDGGAQPWHSECGRYVLVFNGEIYNYLELRAELETEGVAFRSQSDTEVLLALLARRGLAALERLNGMFAFALWDAQARSLTLVRDRLGKKPLYYAPVEGGLLFASELAALRAWPDFDTSPDPLAVHDYFAHQYIGEARTIYRAARKLLPGHVLVFDTSGMALRAWWSLPRPGAAAAPDCEALRALLDDAVHLRLRSDVPVGVFLSGGLDSTLIAATVRGQGADLAAFTIGFGEASFNEAPMAAEVASALGIRHHVETTRMAPQVLLDECVRTYGEPFADPSALPTLALCAFARRHVTVALSGDGVDELFGGYQRYRACLLARRIAFLPRGLRDAGLALLAGLFGESDRYYGADTGKKLRLFAEFLRNSDASPGDPSPRLFADADLRALLPDIAGPAGGYDFTGGYGLETLEALDRMMQVDLRSYLAENILTKVDRASMHNALEVRSPFLDYRIVEMAAAMPAALKLDARRQKLPLRHCFADRLPGAAATRGKHGFAVPVGRWLRRELKSLFEDVVLGPLQTPFLDREYLRRLWNEHLGGRRDHGHRLWAVLVFCRWWALSGAPRHG